MAFVKRINVFWVGAGGFLALFCANELVAHRLSRTPKWLGGPLMAVAAFAGLLLGLAIIAFLGVEEPLEQPIAGPIPPMPRPAPAEASGAPSGQTSGEAPSTDDDRDQRQGDPLEEPHVGAALRNEEATAASNDAASKG